MLFELGEERWVIIVQSIYWAPTTCPVLWQVELRKHKESKRHGSCQKGAHNLVLVSKQSKAIFSCVYCWDLCRTFSAPCTNISLKLIQNQFGSIEACRTQANSQGVSLLFEKLKDRLLWFVKKIWGIFFADLRHEESSWKGIMMINDFFKDVTVSWFKKCSLSDSLIFQVKLHINSYWIGSFKIHGSFDKKAILPVATLRVAEIQGFLGSDRIIYCDFGWKKYGWKKSSEAMTMSFLLASGQWIFRCQQS